ncbi:hypothetical protein F442_02422 [Phytophthora nicotianae P10297]|uniref:Uncharacterized protein n=1 Tax=Phytophthora nicotianae P10297 TaxID=1317064 RepID=W3A007_PHYNI|nr:hypothetical protein F442_02422 [Phytophthora nicotianae P10297]
MSSFFGSSRGRLSKIFLNIIGYANVKVSEKLYTPNGTVVK